MIRNLFDIYLKSYMGKKKFFDLELSDGYIYLMFDYE